MATFVTKHLLFVRVHGVWGLCRQQPVGYAHVREKRCEMECNGIERSSQFSALADLLLISKADQRP